VRDGRRDRAAVFDGLHAADPDPWDAATSGYEREKFAATLAALPRRRFARALDVGCSAGVLTKRLAERCAAVTAVDVSAVALSAARRRCAGRPVSFACGEVPDFWPRGRFDLVLLSEVLYFLEPEEVRRVARRTARSLGPSGTAVTVNWRGPCDLSLDGDAAADIFAAEVAGRVRHRLARRTDLYRIDVFDMGG